MIVYPTNPPDGFQLPVVFSLNEEQRGRSIFFVLPLDSPSCAGCPVLVELFRLRTSRTWGNLLIHRRQINLNARFSVICPPR